MSREFLAGIETGGTKILARISAVDGGETIAERRWETGTADEVTANLVAFLSDLPDDGRLRAIGIAAFGPLIVDPASPDYGRMLETPKPGWSGSNLRAALQARFGVDVGVDTDVNCAAIAEQRFGAGAGLSSVAYVTVGTGIGAGLATRGESLKGALHPEAGHLQLVRRPDDHVPSACPFHSSCAEGLAAGPAVRQRLGEGRELADDPAMIDLVADYLAQLATTLVRTWAPHRVVWGGGIIMSAPIIPLIQEKLRAALGAYGVGDAVYRPSYCVSAALENAGLEGASLMARELAPQ